MAVVAMVAPVWLWLWWWLCDYDGGCGGACVTGGGYGGACMAVVVAVAVPV